MDYTKILLQVKLVYDSEKKLRYVALRGCLDAKEEKKWRFFIYYEDSAQQGLVK